MKKFLLLIGSACVSMLIIILGVECWQSTIDNNVYSNKYNYLKKNKEGIVTLVLGNSFMENSFNPKLIGDSVFDLAISARWIYYDKELLQRYISDMPKLKNVIFGMGYAIPFWRSYHFPEEANAAGHGREFVSNQKYMYEKFMNIRYDKAPYLYWFGFVRGFIDKETLFEKGVQPKEDYDGFVPLVGQMEDYQVSQNINPNIIYNPHAKEQIAEYKEYLMEMAKLCRQNGIRFIVITPPCHGSYIANVRQEGLDILHGMMKDIQTDFPIEYIDYLQDEEFRGDSIYFNCSHLNSVGADLFTLRVKKDFGL